MNSRRSHYRLGAKSQRLALTPPRRNAPPGAAVAKLRTQNPAVSKRARAGQRDQALPFMPPEDWHESTGRQGYDVVVQEPGEGFRHVLTPREIRDRLAALPAYFLRPLEVVQLSRMTRKKQSLPCYGMQWGNALYLYPIEFSLAEYYDRPPRPTQMSEARAYGGRWTQLQGTAWKLQWSEAAIKDFYLNNILLHELGHLLDTRNTNAVDRERYAEWFAIRYGTPRDDHKRKASRRHHHSFR